jgi:hypothetical protein
MPFLGLLSGSERGFGHSVGKEADFSAVDALRVSWRAVAAVARVVDGLPSCVRGWWGPSAAFLARPPVPVASGRPQISASLTPAVRSETVAPFAASKASRRCTNSSTLPLAPQPKQWKSRFSRLTLQLGLPSSWKGQGTLVWSPEPTGVRS